MGWCPISMAGREPLRRLAFGSWSGEADWKAFQTIDDLLTQGRWLCSSGLRVDFCGRTEEGNDQRRVEGQIIYGAAKCVGCSQMGRGAESSGMAEGRLGLWSKTMILHRDRRTKL